MLYKKIQFFLLIFFFAPVVESNPTGTPTPKTHKTGWQNNNPNSEKEIEGKDTKNTGFTSPPALRRTNPNKKSTPILNKRQQINIPTMGKPSFSPPTKKRRGRTPTQQRDSATALFGTNINDRTQKAKKKAVQTTNSEKETEDKDTKNTGFTPPPALKGNNPNQERKTKLNDPNTANIPTMGKPSFSPPTKKRRGRTPTQQRDRTTISLETSTIDPNNPCTNPKKYPTKNLSELSTKQLDDLIFDLNAEANKFDKNEQNATTQQIEERTDKANRCRSIARRYEAAQAHLEKCTEDLKQLEDKKSEFVKNCGEFSTGRMKCSVAIMACKMCPSEKNSIGYECVRVHDRTNCPAKSGAELKSAEKKRDQVKEDMEKVQEEIAELEKDIVSRETELNEKMAELENDFKENQRDLERAVEEANAELQAQSSSEDAQIQASLLKATATVQAEIENSLKVAHSFENAISAANREFRQERRKIIMACEIQARSLRAQYRKKRKLAIQTGSLRISVHELLSSGRHSFKKTDRSLLNKYYAQCLERRKPDFNEVEAAYQDKLKLIEQQREQYVARLKSLRKKLKDLEQQTTQAQNQKDQKYFDQMQKNIKAFEREYTLAYQKYLSHKQLLRKEAQNITVLQKQLIEKRTLLRDTNFQLVQEEGLISHLRSKGVTKETTESKFSEAAASFVEYYDAISIAEASCSEDHKKIRSAREHIENDSSESMIHSFFGDEGNR